MPKSTTVCNAILALIFNATTSGGIRSGSTLDGST